jgi:RHS repeat-associated protein
VTAATSGSAQYPAWGLQWSYDRYGNRKQQTVTAGSAPSSSVTIDPLSNRLSGAPYAYDASGNMTHDGLNLMTYDGESRVVTSATNGVTTTSTYDGAGLRVKKQVGGATATVYLFSGTKVVAEYAAGAAASAPTREYVYSGAALLATIEGGATRYHHADHLSMRVTTDANGTKIADSGHYPFGESWYETGGVNKLKFTSYERDAGANESGNDYAIILTYLGRLARFNRPDPLAGSLASPQSLNRYAYVLNDPLNLADPLGLANETVQIGDCLFEIVHYYVDGKYQGTDLFLLGCSNPHGSGSWQDFVDAWDRFWDKTVPTILDTAQTAICSILPEGRTTSGTIIFGAGGPGLTASAGELVNYNTGERSTFTTSGDFFGVNGAVSVSVGAGAVYDLGTNSDYAGGFETWSGSYRYFGLYGSQSTSNQVREAGITAGTDLFQLPASVGIAWTNYTIRDAGSLADGSLPAALVDAIFFAMRQGCQ